MITLTASARCHGCGWTAQGDPAAVDKGAEKHVAAGHPTATAITPAITNPDKEHR